MISQPWNRLGFSGLVGQGMAIAAVIVLTCSTRDARGQFPVFHSWINAGGGSYADPFAWSPRGVPGPEDGAGFGLGGLYAVTFPSNQTTGSLTVSDGSVTFDLNPSGTARTLTVPGTLTVTSGALTVVDGAVEPGNMMVTAGGILLEALTATVDAPEGIVHVSGEGSALTKSGPLVVGNSLAGTLLVEAGAEVFSDLPPEGSFSGVVAVSGSSTGNATVTGAGATWTNNGGLSVGQFGDGTLTISDGGKVTNRLIASIGELPGSTAEVTVTGSNSSWINDSGFLRIGQSGSGTLLIEDGGLVTNFDGIAIGRFAGSTGVTTVSGTGSTLNVAANIAVGQDGTGTLIVEGGGLVSGTTGRVAAISPDSVGDVTITGAGSRWLLFDFLRVGESGDGTLLIEAGGSVSNTVGVIGRNSGSTGQITVTGADSQWTSSGGIAVGFEGTAALNVLNGGNVSTQDLLGSFIAHQPGSIGTVTVQGTGSTWNDIAFVTVGRAGSGTLNILDGGVVSGIGAVGGLLGATGMVTVDGAGSTWTDTRSITVGSGGAGFVTISNGGVLESRGGIIGFFAGASGTVTVDGMNSAWTNDPTFDASNLTIGREGTGALLIRNGGQVFINDVVIGRSAGSMGSVHVSDAGSAWTIDGRLSVGGDAGPGINGGTGTLNIQPGGRVDVAEATTLFPDGLLQLEGGTLATTEIHFDGGGQFQWTSGTLHVDQYNGPLLNQAGTLAPGRSAGSTTVVGQYTQNADATLEIEIGGLAPGADFDVLTIEPFLSSNDALLDGTLEVVLIDNFVPQTGDSFTIVETTAGNVIGTFAGEILPVFGGLSFDVLYNPQSVVLEVVEAANPAGDFNDDGVVNAGDYVVWRNNEGTSAVLPNDPSGGEIGQAQYETWVANFGSASRGGSSLLHSIPEPGSIVSLIGAMALLLGMRGPIVLGNTT